jgi:hypothetical protein
MRINCAFKFIKDYSYSFVRGEVMAPFGSTYSHPTCSALIAIAAIAGCLMARLLLPGSVRRMNGLN